MITLACMVVPYLNVTIIRTIVSLVFLLFVPGYVFTAAFFPKRDDINNAERAALSVGLSIGIIAVTGFSLNYTPWGIGLQSVALSLAAVTSACAWLAIKRRDALAKGDRFTVRFPELRDAVTMRLQSGSRLDRTLTTIAIASIALSLCVFAYLVATPGSEHFTELYVLGSYGKAKDYPNEFILGQTKPIVAGVINKEQGDASYELVIRLNDSKGNATTLHTEQITLRDGQTWEQRIPLTPDRAGNDMKIELSLYKKPDLNTPYRQAYFWTNVTRV